MRKIKQGRPEYKPRMYSRHFSMTMERSKCGVICVMKGVGGILKYERECMAFSFERESVYLFGEGLICDTYGNGYVRVFGEIHRIEVKEELVREH